MFQRPGGAHGIIPDALEKIVLKALAKEVEPRYQYANELADDLQRFLITSEAIFSRKDLMAYMKSTFAEEVEREKIRIQEYTEIKAPEGLQQVGENDAIARIPLSGSAPSRPSLAAAPGGGSRSNLGAAGSGERNVPPAITPTSPAVAATAMSALRRPASGGGIPKLTAAAPVSQALLDAEGGKTVSQEALDNESGKTILNNPEIEAIQRELRREFQDRPEPATMPSQVPRDLLARANAGGPRPTAQSNRREVVHLEPPTTDAVPPRARADRPTAVNPAMTAESADTSMPADADRGGGKTKWALLALAVLAVGGAGGAAYVFRQPSEGFVVVDVPDVSARSRARINVNGQDLGMITAWPRLQKTSPARRW